MTHWRKGYADGPDGQVHYRDTGRGRPLLLLHQTPCHLGMFDAAWPLLAAAGIRAIGVDTPGYGQSAPPAGVPTIGHYARAALAVLDHLGIGAADVLGHHTGAATAAELAVRAPARVRCVILNGPPLFTPDERRAYQAAIAAAPRPAPQADGSHLVAVWERRLRFTPGWTDLAAMHRGVVMMLCAEPRERDGYVAAFAHDIAVPLRAITRPGLILTNTGDDLYAAACRARELRPDFAFVALAGGTHDIVDEQPGPWSAAVAGFLADMRHDAPD
ncbi:MAG: alpha/beta hydrolase [Gammaproteobacteria bacterium]|nr:alpha/beta hydrolase [Gammaproteobacteria bacterium]